jgi:hypothetical protein
MRKFRDSSVAPIVAMDFDNTISVGDHYPGFGELRPYVRAVMNFLVDIGVKVVVNTSRDIAIYQEIQTDGIIAVHDDITSMITYLKEKDVKFSAINKSVQFAPHYCNSRKIYAHLYVDDRGYGWREEPNVMLKVLEHILLNILDLPERLVTPLVERVGKGEVTFADVEQYRTYVKEYWV